MIYGEVRRLTVIQGGGYYGAPGMFAPEHVRAVCADFPVFYQPFFPKEVSFERTPGVVFQLVDVFRDRC